MAALTAMLTLLFVLADRGASLRKQRAAGASSLAANLSGTAQYAPGPIILLQNGRCLDMKLDGSRDVHTHSCHGRDNQMWYFQGTLLKNLRSGHNYCLDMALGSGSGSGGGTGYGNVYMAGCSTAWNVQFAMGPNTIVMPLAGNRQLDQSQYPGHNHNVWATPFSPQPVPAWKQWTVGGKVTILGRWQPLQPLVDTLTIIFSLGTSKGTSSTKTSTWSSSVTASVEGGIDVLGISGKTSFSATIGHSMSTSHSEFWQLDERWTWEQTLVALPDEQYLWQFQYDISTEHVEDVRSKTKAYAKTAGRWQMPRCLPGYCIDNPKCQSCHPNGLIF